MGQGKEVKTRTETPTEIQERGEIFFFYRPKVEREEAHSPDDVQRLYIVLRPESGERSVESKQSPDSGKEGRISHTNQTKHQGTATEGGLYGVQVHGDGKKTLPDLSKPSTPFWGFVELVTTNIEDIKSALKGEEYDTATRGHRHKPPARPLGEGIYRLVRHNPGNRSTHTHLVYKLEFPPKEEKKEPQESLNIERQGSFVIQIRNPEHGGRGQFQGLQSKRKAVFPAHLHGEFGRRKFIPADPPDLLNYQGCEFLLISASDDVEEELGLELETEEGGEQPECSDLVTTFGECASAAPLFKGMFQDL
ncbi:hypothetical protein Syun_024725 [Stephania yunnanensis]|uniref:Uncharacterized protein n=1 Tax=Stephania yunnanensis TaxID=152371 RepID=A0AAP0HVK5_9MAGN